MKIKIGNNYSQNAENDWNGFDEKPSVKPQTIQKSTHMKKNKSSTETDDFNFMDVKSKVVAPKPVKTQKEEDEIWEMLNK